MAARIRARGPDDDGVFEDAAAGFAAAHRRLSVIDLSPAGHQPMVSESGRYVVVFNGEIYNFRPLREQLAAAGHAFRGHSDTEVLLASVEEWGLVPALERCNGAFALALWDRRERRLRLARDRVGIKPLYFGWVAGSFVFGSELKAIRACPGFHNPVSRDAVAALLRYDYVPSPWCIFEDLYKLRPGTVLTATADFARTPRGDADVRAASAPFWSARERAAAAAEQRFDGDAEEARAALDRLLRDAVASRTVADVPLGAFLSGGVDSSTVTALMQAQSSRPVRTFSIGFHYGEYDEAEYARAVAAHLGTDHTALYVSADQALDVIPRLPELYDEPFADSSQIPTFLVSRLARSEVTVALSGDGGDELFGGYVRYRLARSTWRKVSMLPPPLRRGLARSLRLGPPGFWDRLHGIASPVLPEALQVSQPGHKVHRLADVLQAQTPAETYSLLASEWARPEALVPGARPLPTLIDDTPPLGGFTERLMWMDFVSYLPDDILTKVDRATMVVGLEARVPMLDHRVAEHAWSLPLDLRIHGGQGKWLLRQVLYRYVPRELIERPKQGFSIPLEHWLREPLRDWAEALLDEARLRREGFLHPGPIRQLWAEHLAGTHDRQYNLWGVLMFQAWLEQLREEATVGMDGAGAVCAQGSRGSPDPR